MRSHLGGSTRDEALDEDTGSANDKKTVVKNQRRQQLAHALSFIDCEKLAVGSLSTPFPTFVGVPPPLPTDKHAGSTIQSNTRRGNNLMWPSALHLSAFDTFEETDVHNGKIPQNDSDAGSFVTIVSYYTDCWLLHR